MSRHIDWLNFLLDKLFEPEDKQYVAQVNSLIEKNNEYLKLVSSGFNYCGKNYGYDGSVTFKAHSLVTPLMPEMARIAALRKIVNFDRALIIQVFSKVLEPCESVQDARDVLPECLVSLDTAMVRDFKRTREPAWNIKDDPRALRQFQKTLTKVESYCAMKFLY